MNFPFQPLPLPAALNELTTLKMILGFGLVMAGAIVFSLWKERLGTLKEEEKVKFLMYSFSGSTWVIAIFFACGGVYFLADSILKFHT